MSYRTLERLFVRLLFDPSLVDAMHADPDRALSGLDLEPHERAQLLAVDRRAWRHDPLRRRRTLRTLVDEFKCSTTMALAESRSLASLEAFFSSPEFHACVQERESMALAFGRFLERFGDERGLGATHLPDVARLETSLARCRRELTGPRRPPVAPGVTRVAAGHAAGRYNANVIDAMNTVERYLFEVGLMPAVALCDDAPRLGELPPVADEPVFLLALPSATGVSLMPIDADYCAVIRHFADGAPLPDIPADDLRVMIDSLCEEGVLE